MICKKCDAPKEASDFYESNKSICKECIKKRVKENRLTKIDYYRSYDRKRADMHHRVAARRDYIKTKAGIESHKKANRKWMDTHPDRKRATSIVRNAIRYGRLIPWPVCAIPECSCKPEAHHPDYSRPLDVVWLCDRHHKDAHNIARELKRSGAF